ncbi:MAG: MBL fold metallo-hydrolase [Polyangia bacterium]|jgi:glyoxylase-like metal-dependent hydrolase (beta-lactamase superfamily II)|nr:MBL fold metallo-hydrolase [Polyangia bacterium]
MITRTLTLGPFQTNSYLLGCEATREAVVIDPGFEAEEILAQVETDELRVVKILLTHGHVDHVSAVSGVKAGTGAPVYIHAADQDQYLAAPSLARYFGLRTEAQPPPDHILSDGDEVTFGQEKLSVIHTPGHTPGGVCFLSESAKLLVAGDTLFCRGIGRTNLPGGSMRQLFASIKQRIYSLDGSIRVLPGHGPDTTIRDEMFQNPFVTL